MRMNIFLSLFGLAVFVWPSLGVENNQKQHHELPTVIGIDLGTTYSCVGVFLKGRAEIITNDWGNRLTPSLVSFAADGERLIGEAARNQLTNNPENTVYDVKRLIGREWFEPNMQKDIKLYPFKVVKKNSRPHIRVSTAQGVRDYAPEEISAMVLAKMKQTAEDFLGRKITDAVVTVPARFNDAQRQATKNAAKIAGLNVLRFINEPTAAAMAYGFDRKGSAKRVLVFDLGGGTLDVSLVSIDNGVLEVVATNGDTHLGGQDFDQRVVDHFVQRYEQEGKDIRQDSGAMQKLRLQVEKAKRILSSSLQARIHIESFFEGQHLDHTLTRAKFEELNQELFRSTLQPVQTVLEDAQLQKTDVDEIVLTGGSTRIPKIQQLVEDYFDGKQLSRSINADEAVACGAAIHAGTLSGDQATNSTVLLDVIPLTLGVATVGGFMSQLIPRNTVIPTKKTRSFFTANDNQSSVTIQVYEGERPLTKDNHLLGTFKLTGIPEEPYRSFPIQVTFAVDVHGILEVSAKGVGADVHSQIVVTSDQYRLTPDQIDRMIHDAEIFAEKDKRFMENLMARHKLESYAYSLLKEHGDTQPELKKAIDKALWWLEHNPDASPEKCMKQQKYIEAIMRHQTAALQDEL
ncbi:endoplasmic reticulum chaperone BiP-like [Drosophila subobscura]|uniref:endoplasmic reticulum chaperone BiP-like n=1 Tax=Drosophila subobscura TaxID=7241 RepID=UPI00155A60F3|nr:endoplasmic reticulum chaperone BiP-like [Drosophila subobscura]